MPGLSQLNDTSNSAAVFLQVLISNITDVPSVAFVRTEINFACVSRALPADQRMLCVDIAGRSFQMRVTLCASDIVLINSCNAYLCINLEASHMLVAKHRRSVLRLVWDAIT